MFPQWHQISFRNDTVKHYFSTVGQGAVFSNGTNRSPILKIGRDSIWIDLGHPPQHVGHELTHLVQQIRETNPNRADLIAIVPAKQPGFSILSNGNGAVAILIGLLVPAVQKISEASARNRMLLELSLKPGGVAVMPAPAPARHYTGGRFALDLGGHNLG